MTEAEIEKKELFKKFSKWVMDLQYKFLQDKIFQPIGIELSVVPVHFETVETLGYKNVTKKSFDEEDIPIAFFNPSSDSIHICIDHKSFQIRSESEQYSFLMFLLFHEACHRLLMTTQREGDKEHTIWNIATDYEIHNMYYVYNEIIKNNKYITEFNGNFDHINNFLILKTDKEKNEGLFDKDLLNNVAEEIYQKIINSKEVTSYSFSLNNNANDENKESDDKNQQSNSSGKITVKVSTYSLPNGKKIKISIPIFQESDKKTKTSEEIEKEKNDTIIRKTLMENTIKNEISKSKGNVSSSCQEFLKKIFHIKIDWKKILRNSLKSAIEKSDYFSWARPRTSMFALPNMEYLPSQCSDQSKYGVLVITRDESGSMDNESLEKAAGIIEEAKEYYKKIILIKHDTEISSVDQFDEIEDATKKMLLARNSYGGTSHKEIFEWINKYASQHRDDDEMISCAIFITDMESDIEEFQDIIPSSVPKIYLTQKGDISRHKKVKGVIIQVDL